MKSIQPILYFFLVGIALAFAGCKHMADDGRSNQLTEVSGKNKGNLALKFSRQPRAGDPQSGNPHEKRNVSVDWKLKNSHGGLDHPADANCVLLWGMENSTNINFAIVVPSTNHWAPTNGCYWATSSPVASWPAVLPSSDGKIYLQFLPATNGNKGDPYHYKIVVLPHGIGGKSKTTTQGEDFPPDSDPDILDTTIVWGGGRPPQAK
jgi:hypothetical protein